MKRRRKSAVEYFEIPPRIQLEIERVLSRHREAETHERYVARLHIAMWAGVILGAAMAFGWVWVNGAPWAGVRQQQGVTQ